MKTNLIQSCLLAALLALPVVGQAQFTYTTNNGTITITGYTGSGGAVTIPSTINVGGTSLPVTSIGDGAFVGSGMTSVTIPANVTNIGISPFEGCDSLTAITVDGLNSFYSSLKGVLFDKSQTMLLVFPGGVGGSYTIPGSVTNIGNGAFEGCFGLTNVIVPNSVLNIGDDAFFDCYHLVNLIIPGSVISIGDDAFLSAPASQT